MRLIHTGDATQCGRFLTEHTMPRFSLVNRLMAAAAIASCVLPFSARAEEEKLVPARFTVRTDKLGLRWSINEGGVILNDNTECFANGGMLRIDANSVRFSRPMMTADGSEYVFAGTQLGLKITRRVRLDAERGAVRYLDVFENPGKAPLKVQAVIHTELPSSATQLLTFQEKPFTGALGNDDGGFAIVSEEGRNDGAIIVADPKAKPKPAIRVQGNRVFDVTYPLEIPAGASTAIVHYLAQRAQVSAKEGRDLLAAYYKRGRLFDPSIPKASEKLLANFTFGRPADEDDGTPPRLLDALAKLAEGADLSREKLDGILIDAGSKLLGTVIGGDFEIETVFGKTPVAFANVAGVAGGAGVLRPVRVFLRDGEILSGTVSGVKCAMSTDSGLAFDVDFAQIQLLTMRADARDSIAPAKAALLVTTQLGDRLALSAEAAAPLEAATPWGMARVPLADVRSIEPVREPFPSQKLVLTDRSSILAMLRGGDWTAPTLRFGPVKIAPQSIREMLRLAVGAKTAAAPHCELLGENRIAGTIDLPELHLATESSITPVDPKQIVEIAVSKSDDGAQSVIVKLAGGQELKGRLVETVLPLRSGERVWRVPVAHLVAFRIPEPEPPPEEKKEAEPAKEEVK